MNDHALAASPLASADKIYVALTAYHCLMAAGLALGEPGGHGRRQLIAIKGFGITDLMLQCLRSWGDCPFEEIVVIEYSPKGRPGIAESMQELRLSRKLRERIRGSRLRAVYVFNDRQVFSQVALGAARRFHPAASRIWVEDGTAAYSGVTYRRQHWRTTLQRKLMHGRSWGNLKVLGTHPLVQQLVVHFPEALRPELRQSPVTRYPRERLHDPRLRGLAELIADRSGIPSLHAVDALVIANVSWIFRDLEGYRQELRRLLERLAAGGYSCAIKYHPRERMPDFVNIQDFTGAVELPRECPMEVLFLLLGNSPCLVIGGVTTALLVARQMNPALRPLAMQHGEAIGGVDVGRLFTVLGIPIASCPEEVLAIAARRDDTPPQAADAPQ